MLINSSNFLTVVWLNLKRDNNWISFKGSHWFPFLFQIVGNQTEIVGTSLFGFAGF